MSLATSYLGFRLPHPFLAGASPLSDRVEGARRLEDAGAAMIVLRSLFEEQLVHEQLAAHHTIDAHEHAFAEALTYLPSPAAFRFGPDSYAEHLTKVKAAVGIPVMASLNGTTPGGWVEFARVLEGAGADALELNLFLVPTSAVESSATIEDRLVELVRLVRATIRIPLAVKLSPFYTAVAHFARRLEEAGADGLVLFNRFYEPDIDVGTQSVVRTLTLSTSSELLPRLHGLGIVSGRVRIPLAVTGGVHTGLDALKAIMCGASGVQMVSALLGMEGPAALGRAREELERVLHHHEYDSLDQVRGSMSLTRCPDPQAYERVNYMQILQNWRF
jgi:dihydroorotate dehydrogenase (fumarate)